MTQIMTRSSPTRLDLKKIELQLALCPSLPSLNSINRALQDLLSVEQRYSAQISEVIRRDPSLTSRLLRMVNSVYYGLSNPVNSVEEAVFYLGMRQIRQLTMVTPIIVFYLGMRQIRQLTMVTPIIEDFQKLTKQCAFPWREFWQHSIGAAILTREVFNTV